MVSAAAATDVVSMWPITDVFLHSHPIGIDQDDFDFYDPFRPINGLRPAAAAAAAAALLLLSLLFHMQSYWWDRWLRNGGSEGPTAEDHIHVPQRRRGPLVTICLVLAHLALKGNGRRHLDGLIYVPPKTHPWLIRSSDTSSLRRAPHLS